VKRFPRALVSGPAASSGIVVGEAFRGLA
jgi:hypothetical protein